MGRQASAPLGCRVADGARRYAVDVPLKEFRLSSHIVRLVCGLLFVALVLGVLAHPPENLTQGLGMLLPAGGLLSVAIRGTRRSVIPKKRVPPAPSSELPRS